MPFPNAHRHKSRSLLIAAGVCLAAAPAAGHEAWILTPGEIEALAAEPIPALFRSSPILFAAAAAGTIVTAAALNAERRFEPVEARVAAGFAPFAVTVGALALRLGLAVMLLLAATGGLPRHGTATWTQPTLLVPDMQLSLVPGWEWLIVAQAALGIALALGLATRLSGLLLIGLSGLGMGLYGTAFLSYAPHFAAPGLMLAVIGGGTLSVDRLLEDRPAPVPATVSAEVLWRIAQVMVGGCFVYLAVAYKLTQPTLIIAILEHADFPTFGIPLPWIALIMTGVEIVCGTLLMLGRLTRPVAFLLMGAITFLAITLGETPLFHANLYGIMAAFALSGRSVPTEAGRPQAIYRRAEA